MATNASPTVIEYRFGRCILKTAARELHVAGAAVQTEPRVLSLLIFLIEQRDRVITKDELLARLWEGAVVTDSALAQAVMKTRKALGEDTTGSSVIRTINRIGYRFVAPVEVRHSAPPAAAPLVAASPELRAPAVRAAGDFHALAMLRARSSQTLGLFAFDAEVASWEAALPALLGTQRLEALLPLAWHLRQRDPRRAQTLAHEAEALLDGLAPQAARHGQARLALVHGEVQWLRGDAETGRDFALQAKAAFVALQDPVGASDAECLLTQIAAEDGAADEALAHADAAVTLLSKGGDDERLMAARLGREAARLVLERSPSAEVIDATVQSLARSGDSLGIRAIAGDLAAARRLRAQLPEDCITVCIVALEAALATGSLLLAIRVERRVGGAFISLQNDQLAIEWSARALERARAREWPALIAGGLRSCGLALVRLGRLDDAKQLLEEAHSLTKRREHSNAHCLVLTALSELYLRQGRPRDALECALQVHKFVPRADPMSLRFTALAAEAHARVMLGELESAQEVCWRALNADTEARHYQRHQYWRTLAEIHSSAAIAPPAGLPTQGTALYCLWQARDALASIAGRGASPGLMEAIGKEQARMGDHAAAYASLKDAIAIRVRVQNESAQQQASVLKIQHDLAQLRADLEHQKALALAHARRAESLAKTNAAHERLLGVAQDIAQQHEPGEVFEALERHARRLLEGSSLRLYVLEDNGHVLRQAFGSRHGEPEDASSVLLGDLRSPLARSARERRQIESVEASSSVLHAPLIAEERLLGVLAARSRSAHPPDERERTVFGTLCVFGALALGRALKASPARADEPTAHRRQASLVAPQLASPLGGA